MARNKCYRNKKKKYRYECRYKKKYVYHVIKS